jgi:hypothetical protein
MKSEASYYLVVLFMFWVAGVGTLSAQEGPAITGMFIDGAGIPIGGAEVFLDDSQTPVVTGPTGRFRLGHADVGSHWVFARRIGYSPQRRSITVRKDSSRELVFQLEQLPFELPELETRALSGYAEKRMRDFWFRSRSSWGRAATRDDLERSGAPLLSSYLRRWYPAAPLTHWEVDNYYLGSAGAGSFRGVNRFGSNRRIGSSSMFTRCPPAISINGNPPQLYGSVDDYDISWVEAVEAYRPGMSMPFEFQMYNGTGCGLVVIWLR